MRLLKGTLALLALLAFAPPAFAQPKDVSLAEARARFNEGITFADAGDHEAARLKFNQAWALLKSPAILYNLARSEQLSGHLLEALEHYRLFGKMSSDPKITDVQRQRASENVAELSKKVGQIDIDAPAGAHLSIDGRALDGAPSDPIPVTTGRHFVEAVIEGKVRSVSVDCAAGTVTKARLTETTPEATPPPPPPAPAPITEPPREASPRFWTTGRVIGAGLAVVGFAAVGTGVAFHFVAAGHDDDATAARAKLPSDSACTVSSPPCSGLKDDIDSRNSAETLRNAFLIGGGAFAIGGAVMFFTLGPKASASEARSLRVIPVANGMMVRGAF